MLRSEEAPSRPTTVYDLVRSLRHNELPRNRYFDLHATAPVERARRIHRFLREIERDLLSAMQIEIEMMADGYRLSLGFPMVRLRRLVTLTHEEHALITENPQIAEKLQSARSAPVRRPERAGVG